MFKYQDQINDIYSKSRNTLIILYEDLLSFDPQLADLLKEDPESLLIDAIDAFKNLLKFQGGKLTHQDYFVQINKIDEKSPLIVPIRMLRAKCIDQLIWFNGILIRSSAIRPKLTKAVFECEVCLKNFEVLQLTAKVKWPGFCIDKRCKAKSQSDFRLISKKSEFIDWQAITIQEIPEDLPAGRIPRSIQAILTHDLVDTVKPGDRVSVMGIFKSVVAQSIKNENSTLFKTYVDVNFIDSEDKAEQLTEITKVEKEKIEALAKEPLIQKKIARSIAPVIYGRDDLKMASALCLFGGTRKKAPGGGYKRGDIHILFVGDPGTGKSEVLKSAVDISPRGLYTSGKGSTGVGLTAAVIKDSETGQMNLEAGAIVLANGGIACLSGESKVLFNNEFVRIEELFDENRSFKANSKEEQIEICNLDGEVFSLNSSNMDIIPQKTTYIRRKKYNGKLIELVFGSGYKLRLTPEHMLFDGKILEWKPTNTFSKGDFVVAPLELPNDNKPIYILDIIPDDWIMILDQKQKNQLKEVILTKYGTLSSFNKKYDISRHFLSGGCQIKMGDIKKILNDFNIYEEWKNLPLKYSRIASGETLKITEITPDLSYFLGFIYGDGSVKVTPRRSLITISQSLMNIKQISRLRESYEKFSHRKLREYKRNSVGEIKGRSIYSEYIEIHPHSNILAYLYEYFIGNNLRKIFKLPNECLKAFLAGCLDSDGCVSIKKGKKGDHIYETVHIDFQLSNIEDEGLAITLALRRLNCFARFIKKDNVDTIRITGREDVKILLKALNSYSVKIKEIPVLKHNVSSYSDKIPQVPVSFLCETISSSVNSSLLLKLNIWSTLYAYKIMQYQPSIRQLQKIKDLLLEYIEPDTLKNIDTLTNRKYFLDEIIKINAVEDNLYVYDLYVPNDHNFICNGVFVHNCIDEFDKMETADRSALHEGMEQQTISIAKAGIVATLKAETSIIAAANPHFGRYDRYKTPTQNIRMPPSLLSRFDLIFVVVDKPDKAQDAQMAEHILQSSLYGSDEYKEGKESIEAPISRDFLKKYIKYAKKTCRPFLSDEAKDRIKEFYLELRGESDKENAIISILARNLESLVRLSEAYAKMALRTKATKDDVEEIIKLFRRYLKDTGYDESTGKIDMDRIFVGDSRNNLNKMSKLMDRLKQLFEENGWKPLEKKNVIQILGTEESLDESFAKKAIEELLKDGTLYEPKANFIKFAQKDES